MKGIADKVEKVLREDKFNLCTLPIKNSKNKLKVVDKRGYRIKSISDKSHSVAYFR